jgi:hypothetical protein
MPADHRASIEARMRAARWQVTSRVAPDGAVVYDLTRGPERLEGLVYELEGGTAFTVHVPMP